MPQKMSETATISLVYSVHNGFSTIESCIFGIMVSCLTIFTVVSNSAFIYLMRTSSDLRHLRHLRSFLGSMAWGDLLRGLVIMPLTGQYNILEEWIFGEFTCRMFACVTIFCGALGSFHLSCIAIDRFLATVHPIFYKTLGNSYARLSIGITWMISLTFVIPTLMFHLLRFSRDEKGRYQCDIPQNDTASLLISNIGMGVPYCIIWCIYTHLYCMSRKRLQDKISKTLRTYQNINRNSNRANSLGQENEMSSQSDEEKQERVGCCLPHCSLALRTNFQGTRICLGCNAKIPIAAIKSGLCMVCRAPNDLLAAATRSRIKIFMKQSRRTLFVTLMVTCTFTICYVPLGVQIQVASFCPSCETYPRLTTALLWFAFAMSALNPIVYGVFNKKFRCEFRKLINC